MFYFKNNTNHKYCEEDKLLYLSVLYKDLNCFKKENNIVY